MFATSLGLWEQPFVESTSSSSPSSMRKRLVAGLERYSWLDGEPADSIQWHAVFGWLDAYLKN